MGHPPEWLYWADAARRVPRIWNLYSPEDFVQTRLAEWFHGLTLDRTEDFARAVNATEVRNTKQSKTSKFTGPAGFPPTAQCTRQAMGTVVGALLKGATLTRGHAGRVAWPARKETMFRIVEAGQESIEI